MERDYLTARIPLLDSDPKRIGDPEVGICSHLLWRERLRSRRDSPLRDDTGCLSPYQQKSDGVRLPERGSALKQCKPD